MTANRLTFEGAPLDIDAYRAALSFTRRIENTKGELGIKQLSKSTTLANGTQVYVVSNEHSCTTHVVVPRDAQQGPDAISNSVPHDNVIGIADYVSGTVVSGLMDEVEWEVTDPALAKQVDDFDKVVDETNYPSIVLRLGNDEETEEEEEEPVEKEGYAIRSLLLTDAALEKFTYDEAKRKLAVGPSAIHQPLYPPSKPYSQHAFVKPGMFSGYMRAVVQLLLGVGWIGPKTYEAAWIEEGRLKDEASGEGDEKLNRSYLKDVVDDAEQLVISPFSLPAKWDSDGTKTELLYDYRFNNTHGIGYSLDNKPYLIQISSRGVHAIPFPVDPLSQTEEGRARYLELFPELDMADSHRLSMFEAIGGFPTGDSIPITKLDSYVRAGEVLELLDAEDMEPFYTGGMFGSTLGWVFNYNGTRADNTCTKWDKEYGCSTGEWYTVLFGINEIDEDLIEPFPEHAAWLPANTEGYLIKKAKRLTPAQLEKIMEIQSPDATEEMEARLELLDELEVPSFMSGVGKLNKRRSGYLAHPARLTPSNCISFSGQPQIKFPEPILAGLLSFDFTIEDKTNFPPICDAPMVVVQTKDGLDVINYFYNPNAVSDPVSENTRQPCQISGSWKVETRNESTVIQGAFYTSVIDLRKERSPGEIWLSKYNGRLTGYDNFLSFCAYFAQHGKIVTRVFHDYDFEHEAFDNENFKSAIIIPFNERNVYFTAEYDQKIGFMKHEGFIAPHVVGYGPTTRYGVIYSSPAHWTSVCKMFPEYDPPAGADCEFQEYRAATTVKGGCFDDAPEPVFPDYQVRPSWPLNTNCTGMNVYYSAAFHSQLGDGGGYPGTTWETVEWRGNRVKWDVKVFGDIPIAGTVLREGEIEGFAPEVPGEGRVGYGFYDTDLSTWWFKPSPDNCGDFALMFMTQSWWGNRLVSYEEQPGGDNLQYGSPKHLCSYWGATYVGWLA